MAGAMRKMAVYLGLVEDDLDADYDLDQADARSRAREPYTVPQAADPRPRPVEVAARPVPAATGLSDRVTSTATLRPTGSAGGADVYRIETLHPRSYNDARRIGEEYREGVPVIINLTGMDDNDAKRIVDFAAGLVFGLRGSIERITNKVFLLSPANVDVGAEARAQIAQDGFFNQS
ncbi:MAG: cell division protein SepF [Candidatus Nanopelagicales bacterium]|jgi:cell division inhibitor SepF|nr:cell division protein SepF [Candidatus Nanopelagicales bacterium]